MDNLLLSRVDARQDIEAIYILLGCGSYFGSSERLSFLCK